MSVGSVALILSALMSQSCHNTQVFTKNLSSLCLAPLLRYLRLKSNIGILELAHDISAMEQDIKNLYTCSNSTPFRNPMDQIFNI